MRECREHWARPLMPSHQVIFVEDPYWALTTDNTSEFVDTTTFSDVWRGRGKGEEKELISNIARHAYPVVIVNHTDLVNGHGNIWVADVIDAIKQNYAVKCATGGNGIDEDLLVPR